MTAPGPLPLISFTEIMREELPTERDAAWRAYWQHDPARQVLVSRVPHTPYPYEVDLERARNAPEVLDWIMQIAGKAWGTPAVVGGLACAFQEILDPRATMRGGSRV